MSDPVIPEGQFAELAGFRREYGDDELHQSTAGDDPMRLVAVWFDEAGRSESRDEHNAMSLATSTPDGVPSIRIVLCKAIDPGRAAFRFYTSSGSRKGGELASNDHVALAFYWPCASRQVRVVGTAQVVPRDQVERYFATRPAGSRASAHASTQSRPVASRAELESRALALDDPAIERPPEHWGGYDVVADEIEFWQGRPGRLHDRIAFLRVGSPAVDRFDPAELAAAATEVTDPHGTTWLRTRLQP